MHNSRDKSVPTQTSANRRATLLALTTLVTGAICRASSAADPPDESVDQNSDSPNAGDDDPATASAGVPQPGLPTLGGMQFWADLKFFRGYKIQRNVYSGHYRLLNADNRRFASGTLEECESTLNRLKQAHNLQPDTGHAVIYLHGLGRSSRSLRPVMNAMPVEGYVHIPFEYPSTRVPLDQSASYLKTLIDALTDVEKISFVVHSMGGIVVRRYLMDQRDPRLHRMVMMGTPNRGAELADLLKSNFLFRAIEGPAGQQLVTDPTGPVCSLPIPDFEFGIVAGGKNDDRGYNPLIPGDDDGTVTVASTRLTGAADFLLVPKLHSFLMYDETVIAAVRYFLEHGRFFPDRPPQPIPAIPETRDD